jgi:hypothetical protein
MARAGVYFIRIYSTFAQLGRSGGGGGEEEAGWLSLLARTASQPGRLLTHLLLLLLPVAL